MAVLFSKRNSSDNSTRNEANFKCFHACPEKGLNENGKGILHLKCQLLSCSGEIPMGSSSYERGGISSERNLIVSSELRRHGSGFNH